MTFGVMAGAGCGASTPPRNEGTPVILLAAGPKATSSSTAANESDSGGPPSQCPWKMVLIPGGLYRLGERGDEVRVRDFCLDITEVTARAYMTCAEQRGCSDEGINCGFGATHGDPDKLDHPINCVTQKQALAFCRANGKRLPTEEEWEWAARGGPLARPFPWGGEEPGDQLCWSGKQPRSFTCPVGVFRNGNSAHGIADLAGNMYEWTSSTYEGTDEFVLRGGSWPGMLAPGYRVTSRAHSSADSQMNNYGFRCAR